MGFLSFSLPDPGSSVQILKNFRRKNIKYTKYSIVYLQAWVQLLSQIWAATKVQNPPKLV